MTDHRGTGRAYILNRLHRQRPDLARRVEGGQLSAHAAMVEAGFTSPRFTVQVSTADSVAETLRRKLPPDLLAEVVTKLVGR